MERPDTQKRQAVVLPGRSDDCRRRWLLIFNCQAAGLGHSLNLLSNRIVVEHFDSKTFCDQRETVMARLDDYEWILVAPNVEKVLCLDFGSRTNIWRVPHLTFHGYHPDLCYLAFEGPLSKGPLGAYHSALAYAGFRCGLDENQTSALFCEEIYARLGYFNGWNPARDYILEEYLSRGFDLRKEFNTWSRSGPFMHSINHPKINCLRDLAKAILTRASIEIQDPGLLPHDNLANGPVFPVYPEIGARLGVQGSYLFKPATEYRVMDLDEFISLSFTVYRGCPQISPSAVIFEQMLTHAIACVAATR